MPASLTHQSCPPGREHGHVTCVARGVMACAPGCTRTKERLVGFFGRAVEEIDDLADISSSTPSIARVGQRALIVARSGILDEPSDLHAVSVVRRQANRSFRIDCAGTSGRQGIGRVLARRWQPSAGSEVTCLMSGKLTTLQRRRDDTGSQNSWKPCAVRPARRCDRRDGSCRTSPVV